MESDGIGTDMVAAVSLLKERLWGSITCEKEGGGVMSLEGIVIAEQVVSSPDHTFQAKV